MARRSWKRNSVKGYAVGGMPDERGQPGYLSPGLAERLSGLSQQSMLGAQFGRGTDPAVMAQEQQRLQALDQQRQEESRRNQEMLQQASPEVRNMLQSGRVPINSNMNMEQQLQAAQRALTNPTGNQGMGIQQAMGGMPPMPEKGMPQGFGGMQQTVAQPGMRPPMPGMPMRPPMPGMPPQGMDPRMQQQVMQQLQGRGMPQGMPLRQQAMQGQPGMDPRIMQQMQQQAMQMAMRRQQQLQQRGIRPSQLPSPQSLQQMPTGQARQVLGQTLLGPKGYQQLQQQFMQQAGIRPSERQYNMGRGPMAQQMGQRPQQQGMVSNNAGGMMGQPPQQRSPFQQGIGGMGAAASGARAGAFADGGLVKSRRKAKATAKPKAKVAATAKPKAKAVPKGSHRMPSGRVMKNSAHKKGKR